MQDTPVRRAGRGAPGGVEWALPGERAEQIRAFVKQVPRERGLKRVRDLFGRPQDGEG